MNAQDSPWLTVREVAAYARCGTDTVYEALQAGALEGTQRVIPRGKWTIHRDAVDRWLLGERPARRRRAS